MSNSTTGPRTAPLDIFVVAVLLLLACGIFLAGCGGSTTTTTTSLPTASTTVPGPAGESIVGMQLTATEHTPFEVAQALTQQQPVVVLFYVAGGADDQPVRDALSQIAARYPDIMFALYDYKLPDAYGDLAVVLQVDYTPYAVFIGSDGTVAYTTTGFVDEAVLQQYVDNLQQGI